MTTTMMGRVRRCASAVLAAAVIVGVAACGGPSSLDAVGGGSASEPSSDQPLPTLTPDGALKARFPMAIQQSGVLRVGVSPNFAPLNFKREDGTLTGAETELSDLLGQKTGLRVDFVETNFAGLLSGLKADRFDIVFSGVIDTVTREQEVTFVNYSQVGKNLLIRAADAQAIRDIPDLCGRTVGVTVGTTYGDELTAFSRSECESRGKPAITVQTFDTGNDVKQAIATSRIAGTYASVTANTYAGTVSEGELVTTGEVRDRNLSGALVPKDDGQLVEALRASLQALTDQGVTRTVLDRWKLGDQVLPTIRVNGAAG